MKRFSARVAQTFAAYGLPAALEVRAATADTPAEILLYDEIGSFGISAKAFVGALASVGAGPVKVRINSPGGDVFDGLAIYNALCAHKGGVTCFVDGLAGSAASFIALAGDSMEMAPNAMFMIHNAAALTYGDKNGLAETINVLGKVDGQIIDMYVAKTGGDPAELAAMMDAETWMTAAEAKDAKFCDTITAPPAKTKNVAPVEIVASADTSAADHAAYVENFERRIKIAVASF